MRVSGKIAAMLVPTLCSWSGAGCFSSVPDPYDGPTYDTVPFPSLASLDGGKSLLDAGSATTDARAVAPQATTDAGGKSNTAQAGGGDAGDTISADAGLQADAAAPALSVTSLSFSVLTAPVGGEYNPKNVGALWIADAAGKYVKTLAVWADERREFLVKWCATSSQHMAWCDYTAGTSVDAISSATLKSHRTHTVVWDLTDEMAQPVQAGMYQIMMELTDRNEAGAFFSVSFTLGVALTANPADTANFTAMKLSTK